MKNSVWWMFCLKWNIPCHFWKTKENHEIFPINDSMLTSIGTWLSDNWNPHCQIHWYFFSIYPAWAYLIRHYWSLDPLHSSPSLAFLTPLTFDPILFCLNVVFCLLYQFWMFVFWELDFSAFYKLFKWRVSLTCL